MTGVHEAAAGPLRVLVAGAGVAGLEAVLALHDLAGDAVAVTLIAPEGHFAVRATSVQDPFAQVGHERYDVHRVCWEHGAEFCPGTVAAVDGDQHEVHLKDGRRVGYDALLLTVGAEARPVLDQALTYRDARDTAAMGALVRDVENGVVRRVVFVAPDGPSWPLPLYELALLLGDRVCRLELDAVRLTLVTPEPRPLARFGPEASEVVAGALADVGIRLLADCPVRAVQDGQVLGPGRLAVAEGERIVAAPLLEGPRLPGVLCDEAGFVPVDAHGRVEGGEDLFAAGDCTTHPVKQGGVAAQQADAAAATIARAAGVDIEPTAYEPVLRAKLLLGRRAAYLRHGRAGEHPSRAARHALWWPPSKVAAPHLAPYLEQYAESETWTRRPRREDIGVPRVLHAAGDPAGGVEVIS